MGVGVASGRCRCGGRATSNGDRRAWDVRGDQAAPGLGRQCRGGERVHAWKRDTQAAEGGVAAAGVDRARPRECSGVRPRVEGETHLRAGHGAAIEVDAQVAAGVFRLDHRLRANASPASAAVEGSVTKTNWVGTA